MPPLTFVPYGKGEKSKSHPDKSLAQIAAISLSVSIKMKAPLMAMTTPEADSSEDNFKTLKNLLIFLNHLDYQKIANNQ